MKRANLSEHQVLSLIKRWLNNTYLNNNVAICDILSELEKSGIKLNVNFVKAVIDNDMFLAKNIFADKGVE